MWRYNKILAPLSLVLGGILIALTFTSIEELSAPAHFFFCFALCFCAYVVWDFVLLKDVSTVEQIVDEQNLAYAIHQLIPALLALAAASAL